MVKEILLKKTEIGLIPKDWEIVDLNKLATIDGGLAFKSNDFSTSGEYQVVKMANLYNGKLDLERNATFISELKIEALNSLIVKDDILITLTGTTGKRDYGYTVFIEEEKKLLLNQRVGRIKVESSSISKYVYYFTKSAFFDLQFYELSKGGTGNQTNVSISDLKNLQIPLPPLPEQEAIAEALSDCDAWIDGIEQLLAKKRLIKQGAMQELLTPKADWEESTILSMTSNIIDYRGVTPKKLGMDWGDGNIVALSAGNVKKGFIDFNSDCYYGSEDLYKRWMRNGNPKKNDIVFTLEAPLGNIALIPDDNKYILSQRTILLQLRDNFNSKFIFQLLSSSGFQNYILESATGSTAQGIKRQTFEKLKVNIPKSLSEQTRIANILSDMDAELDALEQKLAKARQIKQGMMQELLTGRVRLV